MSNSKSKKLRDLSLEMVGGKGWDKSTKKKIIYDRAERHAF